MISSSRLPLREGPQRRPCPRDSAIRTASRRLRPRLPEKRNRRTCGLTCRAEKTPRVIAIGEALFDMLANDYDVPRELVRSWTPKAGGAACNVAACLAKLGVDVSFITSVGRDDLGDQLIEILSSAGVMVENIKRRSEPTRDVYVTRTSDGEREFVGFGREADQYADCHIDPLTLPTDALKATRVVVTGTLGLAYDETAEAIRRATSIARESDVCVLVDVNWRPVFFQDPSSVKHEVTEFAQSADLVKMTNDEVEWMFGIDAATALQTPCQVLEKLEAPRGVLVTAGPDGAAYCFRSQSGLHSGFIPAFAIRTVDTTGAGDAFTAGFVCQMIKNGGLEILLNSPEAIDNAIEFASACGAIAASGPGAIEAQPSSEADVLQFIAASER